METMILIGTRLHLPESRLSCMKLLTNAEALHPQELEGFYIGPSMHHNHCHKVYLPSTNSVCDAMILNWFPKVIPFPKVTTDDYLHQTVEDMLVLFSTHG